MIKQTFLISAALLAGSVNTAFAQKDITTFGVKLGMNIATMTNGENPTPRVGLNIGVSGQYFVTSRFALEGNFLYSQQGLKEREDGVNGTIKIDYLTIPLLAKFYPMATGFNIYGGPQFGFAVNKKVKVDVSGVTVEESIRDLVNTFDFGLALGMGYDFDFGLTLDLRCNPGFTRIFKYDIDGENSRNVVFTIGAGYKF
ncbi:MAG: porin family protein [Bacteroidales bacterium]